MKAFKLWLMALMVGSIAVNKVGARDVGGPTGLSLAGNEDEGKRPLLRSNTNSDLGPAVSVAKGKGTPGAMVEELKDRLDALSARVSGLAEGPPSDADREGLVKEFHNVQVSISMNPSFIAKATFEEKIMLVKEMSNAFVLFGQLIPMLEEFAQDDMDNVPIPFNSLLGKVKDNLEVAETVADDFVALLTSFSSEDTADLDEDFDYAVGSADAMETGAKKTARRLARKSTSGSSMKSESHRRITVPGSFDQESDTGSETYYESTKTQRHWHGFKDGRQYREWKSKHTRSHPEMNHVFQVLEHMHTGNHEALHEKLLGMTEWNAHEEHQRGRRLQSSASKLEQCDLLTKCAKGLSMYDMVFYHFSDYINTNTGKFTNGFKLPGGFDLIALEDAIKAAITDVESVAHEGEKLKKCDILLSHFHREEPTKDQNFWAWKAGVVSEVCYSSGTTKKIGLRQIMKYIGREVAVRILQETIDAIEILHSSRNRLRYPGELRVFKDDIGQLRYPRSISGFATEVETKRPIFPVNLEDFYILKGTSARTVAEVTFQTCPAPSIFRGYFTSPSGKNALLCHRNAAMAGSHEEAAAACQRSGGVPKKEYKWDCYQEEPEAGSDHPVLATNLFESVARVFGDVSLGQIAALTEVHSETFSVSTDKICPRHFDYLRSDNDGVVCERRATPGCDHFCAKINCSARGGKWQQSNRLIAEVKDGQVLKNPHMIAGLHQQLGKSNDGFNNHWKNWGDVNAMIATARASYQQAFTLDLYGPDKTSTVKSYSQAVAFCELKGSNLASLADVCQDGVPTFGQLQGDQWMPVSDMDNNWIQVGTASHKVCVSHRDAGHGAPAWGNDPNNQIASAANYVLCKKEPTILFGPDTTSMVKSYSQAVAFCESKGYRLASYADICRGGVRTFGRPQGDQWIPVSDDYNEWIQAGTLGTSCESHTVAHGNKPAWGTDPNHQITSAANYLLCKREPTILFGPDKTSTVKSYPQAEAFCRAKGHGLASFADVCSNGVPTFGQLQGDQWIPVSDDSNEWIQAGTVGTLCESHTAVHGKPAWGTDPDNTIVAAANYILCAEHSGFIVVSHKIGVTGYFSNLTEAKAMLNAHAIGSRIIAEVKGGSVVENPEFLAGQQQSVSNGFDRYWSNGNDIDRMIAIAKAGAARFVVARDADDLFVSFWDLEAAKTELRKAGAHETQNQMIFEVHEGSLVGADPNGCHYTVDGQSQGESNSNGFTSQIDSCWNEKKMANKTTNYLKGPTILYGQDDTSSVKTYTQAVAFCESKGHRLASFAEACGFGSVPTFGQVQGDQWIPVSDELNEWIQAGTVGTRCESHTVAHGKPAWGTDSTHQITSVANYVLCKKEPTILYGPDKTSAVKTYTQALAFCEAKGHRLASFADVCQDDVPTIGRPQGDQWMPVSNMDNNWIQVGTVGTLCASHRDQYDNPPKWGTDPNHQITSAANYVLCREASTFIAVVEENASGGVFSDLDAAKTELTHEPHICKFSDGPGSGTYSVKGEPQIPGYCCLDAADISGTWGEPYHCEQKCQYYAPSFAGVSQSTCDIWGGKFCLEDHDCSPLKRCTKKYLVDAQATGTSTFNPTFAKYLLNAPNITDPYSADQCGKAREYYGFEKTFPIDLKICNEVGEYKNAGDMKFLEDVVKKMPESFTSSPPLLSAGGGGEEKRTRGDNSNIDNFQITKSIPQTTFGEAAPPSGQCNAVAQNIWKIYMFTAQQVLDVFEVLWEIAMGTRCPDPGDQGFIYSTCEAVVSAAIQVIVTSKFFSEKIFEIADFTRETICGFVDPYSMEETFEEVKAVYANTNVMYDVLAQRQAQSHKSLNNINSQLPKVGDSLMTINEAIVEMKGDESDATLSRILGAVNSQCGRSRNRILSFSNSSAPFLEDDVDGRKYSEMEHSIGQDALEGMKKDVAKLIGKIERKMADQERKIENTMEDKIERMMDEQEKRIEKMLQKLLASPKQD